MATDKFRGVIVMLPIETKGRVLSDGSLQLDEPINVPPGEVRLVIVPLEARRQGHEDKLSPEERDRIITLLDSVASLSLKDGPPVSNREHDHYLYGSGS